MDQTKRYGVAGLVYSSETWQLAFGISTGEVYTLPDSFANNKNGFSEITARIDEFLHRHSLTWYRVLLLYSPPGSTQLFPILYRKYGPVIVVYPQRLNLHGRRLGKHYDNKSLMLVEAALTGLTTDLLLIETTNSCTFRCLFCPQDIMSRKKARLPFETAKQVVEEYAATGLGGIAFHLMGEPTLNPYLPDLIQLVSQLGIEHTLTTNASSLTRNVSIALFKNGLQRTQISVQTTDKEQFYAYKRPAPKYTYERVLENIKIFIQTKWQYAPDSEIEIHVMDNSLYQPRGVKSVINDKEAEKVVRFWSDFLTTAALEMNNEAILRQLKKSSTVTLARERWDNVNFKFEPTISLKFKMAGHWIQNFLKNDEIIIRARRGTCHQISFGGYNQMAILANGDAIMCCFDYDGNTMIGNIYDDGLSEIDRRSNEIRNQLIDSNELPFEICKRCLGIRIKCFSLGVHRISSPQKEINLQNIAVYGTTTSSLMAASALSRIGIQQISYIREDTMVDEVGNNSSLPPSVVHESQELRDEIEAIIFPAEWDITAKIIESLKHKYPNKIIAQIDVVALNNFDRSRILAVNGSPERKAAKSQESISLNSQGRQSFWAKQCRRIMNMFRWHC